MGSEGSEVRSYRTLIIGAGFSGIGMGIRLRQRGDEDFVIYEKEAGVGGTWRVNQYPGCACDIPSRLYSFSFELNPGWSRRFSAQPEIRDYLEACTRKHGLLPHIRFNTTVSQLRWIEARGLWAVTDESGRTVFAQVVVAGTGALSTPVRPEIPGLESFAGELFHSQHWAPSAGLQGRRVGVVGTGASAVQFIPRIQPQVAALRVFQRTPAWILPKPDRAVGAFEQRLLKAFPRVHRLLRGAIFALLETRVFGFVLNPRLMLLHKLMALNLLRRQVPDAALRRQLTPRYRIGCKRILMANDYYPALQQENVELVTSGIREVNARGLVTDDGREHALDVLILATGFSASAPFPPGMIFGSGGQDIVEAWQDGPQAYKGTTVSGFPNLFLLMGPNTGLGHNSIVYIIESQIDYVLGALDVLHERALQSLEVRKQVQARFNERLQSRQAGAVWAVGQCRSWYRHPRSGRNVVIWPGFSWAFRRQTRHFDVEAYHLDPRRPD